MRFLNFSHPARRLFSLFEHEVAVVFLGGEAVGAHL